METRGENLKHLEWYWKSVLSREIDLKLGYLYVFPCRGSIQVSVPFYTSVLASATTRGGHRCLASPTCQGDVKGLDSEGYFRWH